MTIPSFLLAKLYVKGSLRNNDEGFEFALKNVIDSTSLSGIGPVAAGDLSYGPEAIVLAVGDRSWLGQELSASNAAPVAVGVPLRITVKGERLAPGAAKLSLSADSVDIGRFKFDIADTVG